MLDKVFVGPRVSRLDTGAPPERVSRVTLVVDGSNAYTAGDDAGRTVEKNIPWATQEMAESVLRRLQGVEYRPFSGDDALLDPASEIGDGVTAGGVYSVLAKADITFDGLYSADIAAPGGDEVEDEYPYRSRAQRQSKWELARIRSSITKTAESVRIAVKTVNAEVAKLADFNITVDKISSRVENAEKGVSTLTQTVDGFSATVKNLQSGMSQTLRIAADGVTITNASGSTLTIDGGQIKANSISANKIDVDSLHIKKVYGSNNKMCIGENSSSTLFIGGDGAWNYVTTRIFAGSQISLSDFNNPAMGVLFDMNSRAVTSSTLWTLGTASKPWGPAHTGQLTVYAGSTAGMVMTSNQLYCKQTSNSLGTASYPWESAQITTLYLGGKRFYPDRVSYSDSVYALMDSGKAFRPYGSTGYSMGSKTYPWESGYFTKLYINGTEFAGSSAVSELANAAYKVSLNTSAALVPGGNNTYTLGSSSYYWKTAYISTIYLSASCYISAGSASTIKVGTTTIGGGASGLENGSYSVSLNTSGALLPKASAVYSLGSSSYYWKYLYVQQIYLQYNSYTSLYLTCNASKKLCVNGTAIH